MVDLENQGQTIFLKLILFSRSAINIIAISYIIYFRFFKFLDFDYVKINNKIESVGNQPKIMKVI